VELALALPRQAPPELIEDARMYAPLGNSNVGAVLTQPLGPIGARQYAEAAVCRALYILDAEQRRGA